MGVDENRLEEGGGGGGGDKGERKGGSKHLRLTPQALSNTLLFLVASIRTFLP